VDMIEHLASKDKVVTFTYISDSVQNVV
jgi:hypothetical protein